MKRQHPEWRKWITSRENHTWAQTPKTGDAVKYVTTSATQQIISLSLSLSLSLSRLLSFFPLIPRSLSHPLFLTLASPLSLSLTQSTFRLSLSCPPLLFILFLSLPLSIIPSPTHFPFLSLFLSHSLSLAYSLSFFFSLPFSLFYPFLLLININVYWSNRSIIEAYNMLAVDSAKE